VGAVFGQFGDDQDAIPFFVTCASVFCGTEEDRYRFGTAYEVSPMIAALKYLALNIVVTEVYVVNRSDTGRAWERMEKCTSAHADNGAMYLAHCMKVCNRVRPGEAHSIRFVVCPQHALCAIVDGHELSLPTLGVKMKELQTTAMELTRELLCGLEITDGFWEACGEMEDNLGDCTAGYWSGMNAANYSTVAMWRKLHVAKAKARMFTAGGSVNEANGVSFLDVCAKLQEILYVLIQVCSGAPGRATEVGVIQVCNTAEASRNIFVSQGQLSIAVYYHKGRNMRNGAGKPIVRFPDSATSALLLLYLIILRPMEVFVVRPLALRDGEGEEEAGKVACGHRDNLFLTRGRVLSAAKLRYSFEKVMRGVGIPFTTSQYRHYHAGVAKNAMPGDEESMQDSMAAMHHQAGHSEKTAHQVYGVSALDMRAF